jgi:hypothetical protein
MARKRSQHRDRRPPLPAAAEPSVIGRRRKWWIAAALLVITAGAFVAWSRRPRSAESVVEPSASGAPVANVPEATPPVPSARGARDSASGGAAPAEPLPRVVTPAAQAQETQQQQGLMPQHDGWQSEQLAELADQQLKQLLHHAGRGLAGGMAELAEMLDSDFACSPLRPAQLERVYRDDTVVVLRATAAALRSASPDRGSAGLSRSLATLQATLGSDSQLDALAKIYQVQRQENVLAVKVRVELNARPPGRRAQIRSDWDCLWTVRGDDLRLSAIRVSDYEEAIARYADIDWFVDCTQAALGHNASYHDQLLPGLDYWLQRVERAHRMHVFMASGIAVGDANGDNLEDLHVCQPGGLPNRLYLQNQDGTATDVSMRARVDWLDSTSSALFVDLDNDGDQDLVLATLSGLLVMQNDGAARFDLVGTLPTGGGDMQSLSAADYDNDGDLDLYICLNFPKVTSETGETGDQASTFVYHDANDGAPNRLFRNEFVPGGSWHFTDVTQSSGLDVDNRRHSLAAAWEDYDNDGDQDLYVANDYGQNCLYRNDGGQFVNVAGQAGVVDFGSGMSVSWADYNRDGQMDLYVGNMFSSAGSRITTQPQFRPGADATTRSILRRFAKGNSLFQNGGQGTFQDVGAAAGVEMARWAWSSLFLDLNNSGWEDILVANGYITTEDTGDL